MVSGYDDFLFLMERDLSRDKLIVFYGRSGSGKSTAISFLLSNHPDFRDKERHIVRPYISGWSNTPPGAAVTVIDEIQAPRDMLRLPGYIQPASHLVVASHVPLYYFSVLYPVMAKTLLHTDRDTRKLVRYLHHKGVSSSPEAIVRYTKKYRATYTDLDIILEYTGEKDLGRALDKFDRLCLLR